MNKEELEFKVNQIVYRKVFDDDDCERIKDFYNIGLVDSSVLAYSSNYKSLHSIKSEMRKSKEKFLNDIESYWIKEKLLPHMKEINDTFFQITALSFGQFGLLEYGVEGEFKWHADLGIEGFNALRRISMVIFLSDRSEYEGGQLEFMPKLKEPLKMEKGYLVAFPSHKVHRVAPVTSGVRRTMINFIHEYRE
jgi:PKHD-type hydroxylase